ncbi:MAG TPA: hypothetical protein VMI55_05855 [Thermoplasmata archaeon]|nr:hypothetical protein [Thermoplasmata archaeon]
MGDDPDAETIQREREQRRAAERLRMEEARRERQFELDRLREIDAFRPGPREATRGGKPPRLVLIPGQEPEPSEEERSRSSPAAEAPPSGRKLRDIGGTLPAPSVEEFLQTNPTERFDLLTLNTLRLPPLIDAAHGDANLLAVIARRAEALMMRVKQETDDPLSAGAFLRDQVLYWYRESPGDAGWASRMPDRWAGLFSDSRASGGRLQPWLNLRLWAVRDAALRSGRLREKVRRGILRDKGAEAAAGRTASQQIHAEVAQAILDDLATRRREPGASLPLVRLSELAVRRQVPTVNDALALLFNAPETGPFVVLHPNRYPDCEELQIRPPSAGATGAALAFSLVPGRPLRKGPTRARGGSDSSDDGTSGPDSLRPEEAESELDESNVWEAESVPKKSWARILEAVRREHRRLEGPPKDYRTHPAYPPLLELVLEDAEFRKLFLSVKWRGRPSGLPLLVSLLQKGVLAPEVATDHEYLEAELGELAQGDPQWKPTEGVWTIPGWRVTREGSHRDGYKYRAERAT